MSYWTSLPAFLGGSSIETKTQDLTEVMPEVITVDESNRTNETEVKTETETETETETDATQIPIVALIEVISQSSSDENELYKSNSENHYTRPIDSIIELLQQKISQEFTNLTEKLVQKIGHLLEPIIAKLIPQQHAKLTDCNLYYSPYVEILFQPVCQLSHYVAIEQRILEHLSEQVVREHYNTFGTQFQIFTHVLCSYGTMQFKYNAVLQTTSINFTYVYNTSRKIQQRIKHWATLGVKISENNTNTALVIHPIFYSEQYC